MATITARANDDYITTLVGAPGGITDWAILVYPAWAGAASTPVGTPFTAPIEEILRGGKVTYVASPLAPQPPAEAVLDDDDFAHYLVVWTSGSQSSDADLLLVGEAVATNEFGEFASLTDLAIILGRTSAAELTTAEALRGALLLSLATGLIATAVDRDAAWSVALNPVPVVLRAVCLEMVARVMRNPSGARSENETLGQYQHGITWSSAHGLMLTESEAMLCRHAIVGTGSGSAHLDSIVTQFAAGAITHDGWLNADDELDL